VIKTGDTLPEIARGRGDFEDWIAAGLGSASTRVVDVARGERLPEPSACVGVVVTGSSAMVSDQEEWSEAAALWLATAVEVGTAVLGICYGHQLLARALGGRVGRNPRGREIGSVDVTFRAVGDPLLGFLPVRARLQASHVESVLELPPGVRSLAWSALDPHHAFRVGERAWGVQFHPEFDADVSRAYVRARRAALCAEGLDPDALGVACGEAPHGRALLARFARLVRAGGDVTPASSEPGGAA
jgi:GMP synthase (glutamine-hydrolysing)